MKIAIIGTGISGLTAAYLLNRKHDISVFEAGDTIGGHTATVDIQMPMVKSWRLIPALLSITNGPIRILLNC